MKILYIFICLLNSNYYLINSIDYLFILYYNINIKNTNQKYIPLDIEYKEKLLTKLNRSERI